MVSLYCSLARISVMPVASQLFLKIREERRKRFEPLCQGIFVHDERGSEGTEKGRGK